MWNLTSRIHKLNHFPNEGVVCYVKRDDELGCGISGSKLRKYASLIPHLIDHGIKHLIIIAGPQSNNLLAALQIARELQLQLTAFLIKPRNFEIQGNFKLSRLFLAEDEIIWVDRNDWPNVEELANHYLKELHQPGFVLSEGASVAEAMLGASSIATDILHNEKLSGVIFQHIFVDAGTGFSAAALIKGLMELNHPAIIHVLLLADDEKTFQHKLIGWIGQIPAHVCCFYPSTAKSFGSINQTIRKEMGRLAREEGLLADPIYSAKLFHSARKRIESEQLKGNILIIHSGGTLTMAGFEW
ncbi:pyridoxal-phosphate dependent enzyme [Legionella micdadei]|uniref:D-cysteine desulfhydrase n=1 Tax=Legionella micdadei TaxID=451 RepID=A0A098GHT4_LEGMI|nr:pyridoxal-phosphate dependent enzyme [Legionella micdadei]ARG97047.1 1-aminocyclopropane-1-carboxylate deaminase [Legionella micdadei]ARH00698.1 1-aminocyclopropane-1-carboxylate deaminase [Legionella micdadei]KTD26765.1 1-aminocyclopropane-1-carboxylate deaminase [Legionella micdadei]NSL18269.1 pyridoxal-phosphate dependent enzyme [Legionella micdadei]CEG61537.1 putative 1-aminocyclopropane-1-carboxylate deaminase [Legionella micdadei]